MIKVTLRNGDTVAIRGGKAATFNRATKNTYLEEVVATTLDVRDKDSYGGNLLASFQVEDVIYFTVENETEEEE